MFGEGRDYQLLRFRILNSKEDVENDELDDLKRLYSKKSIALFANGHTSMFVGSNRDMRCAEYVNSYYIF